MDYRRMVTRMVMSSNIVYVNGKTIKNRFDEPEIKFGKFFDNISDYRITYYNNENEFDSERNIIKFVSKDFDTTEYEVTKNESEEYDEVYEGDYDEIEDSDEIERPGPENTGIYVPIRYLPRYF